MGPACLSSSAVCRLSVCLSPCLLAVLLRAESPILNAIEHATSIMEEIPLDDPSFIATAIVIPGIGDGDDGGPSVLIGRMFSGCRDDQLSSDVMDVTRFGLPNAEGAGGACTHAFLVNLVSPGAVNVTPASTVASTDYS